MAGNADWTQLPETRLDELQEYGGHGPGRYMRWLHCTGLCLVLAPLGCGERGPDAYRVHGKVAVDGTAVPTGMVTFVDAGSGRRVNGSIGPDGSYEVLAPPGRYRVAVIAVEETPIPAATPENWRETFASSSPKQFVPSLFGDTETSPLTYTVEPAPDNAYDIDIPSPARRRR